MASYDWWKGTAYCLLSRTDTVILQIVWFELFEYVWCGHVLSDMSHTFSVNTVNFGFINDYEKL